MFDLYQYTPGAIQGEQDTQAAGSFAGPDGKPWGDVGQDFLQYFADGQSGMDPISRQLAALGYTGPLIAPREGGAEGGGLSPQAKAFMDAKFGPGWTVAQDDPGNYGKGAINYRVFKNDNGSYSQVPDLLAHGTKGNNDFMSNGGQILLAALGGAAAGQLGAAGSAAGEGSALASGMDLAADAGAFGGNSIGAAGSALGGAGAAVAPEALGAASAAGGGSQFAANAGYDMASLYPEAASGFSAPSENLLFGGGMLDGVPASTDYLGSYLGGAGGAEGSLVGSGVAAGGAPLAGSLMTGAGGLPAGVGGPVTNALAGVKSLIGGGSLGGGSGLTSLIGNGLGAVLNSNAISKAADAQRAGIADSNALLRETRDQIRADNMPALNARNNGLAGYQGLLKDPSSVANDPGYAWARDQGQLARDRTAAAKGMLMSGPQIKGAIQYGNDYATTKYDNVLNRYGNLAGLGSVGAGTIANAGQSYGNGASQNALTQGQVNGSSYVSNANNWTGAIGNTLNNWQQNELLKRLGLGGG